MKGSSDFGRKYLKAEQKQLTIAMSETCVSMSYGHVRQST